jgi:hypothetical protein
MSVVVSALCWPIRLPAAIKIVLLCLADHAHDNGKRIFPSIGTVAEECGCSPRAVRYAFRALTEDAILVLERETKGGRGHTNVYSLDMVRLKELGKANVPERGGPSSVHMNGAGRAENHAPDAGFSAAENHAPDAGLAENPARGAQNPARGAAEPSLTVKEDGGGGAGAREIEVGRLVAGLAGLPPSKIPAGKVAGWFAKDYDAERDIFPAVVEVVATTPGGVVSFNCFDRAIERYHVRRTENLSNVSYLHRASGGGRGRGMSAGASDLLKAANGGIIEIGGLS